MSKSWLQIISAVAINVAVLTSATAQPTKFNLDDQHTHIVWQVDRFGFTKTVGTFATVSGALMLDEQALERSKVDVAIALSGLRSDLAQREQVVRSKFWLNAASHPEITFSSSSVVSSESEACDTRCVTVNGQMTLNGVSAPLSFAVQLNKIGVDPVSKRKAAGFSASGKFTRSDFDISTALGPIGNEVTFHIEALAIAADQDP